MKLLVLTRTEVALLLVGAALAGGGIGAGLTALLR